MQDNRWQQPKRSSWPRKINDQMESSFRSVRLIARLMGTMRVRLVNKLNHWKNELPYFFWACYWLAAIALPIVTMNLSMSLYGIDSGLDMFLAILFTGAMIAGPVMAVELVIAPSCGYDARHYSRSHQHTKDLR